VGKAIMAYLPETQVEEAVRKHGLDQLTRKTITNMLDLRADLAKVRSLGYAIDDEEHEEGVLCVGAPVWSVGEHPIAAISVSGPIFRLSHEKVPAVAELVMAIARALSRELGMRPTVTHSEYEGRQARVVGAW
jgi:DNA-binding IclR family transcriptional regulator